MQAINLPCGDNSSSSLRVLYLYMVVLKEMLWEPQPFRHQTEQPWCWIEAMSHERTERVFGEAGRPNTPWHTGNFEIFEKSVQQCLVLIPRVPFREMFKKKKLHIRAPCGEQCTMAGVSMWRRTQVVTATQTYTGVPTAIRVRDNTLSLPHI